MFLDSLLGALRDRIQLWRSPGSRTALERQEVYLQGQKVTNRHWETHDTPEGAVTTRVATTGPVKETVAPLPEDMMAGVREMAGHALMFVRDHLPGFDTASWSLQDLDDAFANWIARGDHASCPPEIVEQIVGSAFGEFCARQLDMHWILVTDAHGTAAAIEGDGSGARYKTMRSFPFAAVSKRIASGEAHFLVPIYRVIKGDIAD